MSRSKADKRGGHYRYGQGGAPKSTRRFYHHEARARARDRIAHEDYDLIGTDRMDHHHSADWDWW